MGTTGYIYRNPVTSPGEANDSLYDRHFDYKYPKGLDLKPGSDLHEKIVRLVMEESDRSAQKIVGRHDQWQEIDRVMTAYIPASQAESGRHNTRANKLVIMPILYAIRETILAQLAVAFLDMPMFRYTGGDDMVGPALLQKVVEWQNIQMKTGLAIHTLINDFTTYGIGVAAPYWKSVTGQKVVSYDSSLETNPTNGLLELFGISPEQQQQQQPTYKRKLVTDTLYEGTKIANIDVYKYLPDPDVPIYEPQDGNSTGWIYSSRFESLLDEERDKYAKTFNCKYLRYEPVNSHRVSAIFSENRRDEKSSLNTNVDSELIDVVVRYKRIIPKDWNLGDSEYPENWEFRIAADSVVIKASPCEFPFDSRFPTVVGAPDFNTHDLAPISRLEVHYNLQQYADMLVSSHLENVKRAVNDIIVYDPSVINSKDVSRPVPGGRWRIKRRGFGRDIRQSLFQVPAQDYTRNNVNEALMFGEVAYKGTGAQEQLQGSMRNKVDRLTATEFQGTTMAGLTRIDRMASVFAMQVMQDLGRVFADNTQWRMSKDLWVDLAGEYDGELRAAYGANNNDIDRILVDPTAIASDYSIVPSDPRIIKMEDPKTVVELLRIASTHPELSQRIDILRYFMHAARLGGAKHTSQFRRTQADIASLQEMQAQTMETEAIQEETRKGNIVPIDQVPQ